MKEKLYLPSDTIVLGVERGFTEDSFDLIIHHADFKPLTHELAAYPFVTPSFSANEPCPKCMKYDLIFLKWNDYEN